MALNITKGEWKLIDRHGSYVDVSSSAGAWFNFASVVIRVDGKDSKEGMANAKLIAESGTVANECGLTPSELLEQRDELLEALELADLAFSGKNMNMAIIERKIKAALLKARNASVE